MTAPLCFVDTNVLVYTYDTTDPQKREQAGKWIEALWQNQNGCVSVQVFNEFYITATRKLEEPISEHEARQTIRELQQWQVVSLTPLLLESAWNIQENYKFSWWDSLIVAAAQIADCRYLLSEDLQHNQQIDSIRILNPFIITPGEVLE